MGVLYVLGPHLHRKAALYLAAPIYGQKLLYRRGFGFHLRDAELHTNRAVAAAFTEPERLARFAHWQYVGDPWCRFVPRVLPSGQNGQMGPAHRLDLGPNSGGI